MAISDRQLTLDDASGVVLVHFDRWIVVMLRGDHLGYFSVSPDDGLVRLSLCEAAPEWFRLLRACHPFKNTGAAVDALCKAELEAARQGVLFKVTPQ